MAVLALIHKRGGRRKPKTTLDLKPGATAAQVEEAAKGHVKATGDLVGTFAR